MTAARGSRMAVRFTLAVPCEQQAQVVPERGDGGAGRSLKAERREAVLERGAGVGRQRGA